MKKLPFVLLALFVLRSAFGFELLSDDRRVEVFSTDGNSLDTPAPPFSDFTVQGQSTSFTADGFSGSGNGYGESDFDFYVRQSIFDVTFAIDSGTDILFFGNAIASGGSFGLGELQVDVFALDGKGGQSSLFAALISADTFDEVTDTFAFADGLTPGTYRISLKTNITPGGFDTYVDYTFSAILTSEPSTDSDGDGVSDGDDNCTTVANASQFDGDADGYGNACDADFNNDCVVNTQDLGVMRLAFFSSDATTDLTEDGVVNAADLGALRLAFFGEPGPSGVGDACAAAH